MRMLVAVVVGMTMCACSLNDHPSDSYEVDIDPGFSVEQAATVMSAALEWQQKIADVGLNKLTLDFKIAARDCPIDHDRGDGGCKHVIVVKPSTRKAIAAMTMEDGDGFIGYTFRSWTNDVLSGSSDWATSFLSTDEDAAGFRHTAMHEFGHALALVHETDKPNMMCPATGDKCTVEDVTWEDVAQYNAVRLSK